MKIMKYDQKKKNLEAAQRWFDSLPERLKSSLKRPGSINQRTLTGA